MISSTVIGGLKVKEDNDPGFDNILEMMKSDSAKISTVTYTSLYGFILKLTVDSKDSRYNNLSDTGNFTSSQTDFILKLVPVQEDHEQDIPNKFQGKDKRTNIDKDFIKEADVQMDIFAKSIVGGKEPICPGIADIQILTNDASDIVNFLRLVSEKAIDEDAKKICAYLNKLSKTKSDKGYDIKLGILTMATIESPVCLYEYHNNALASGSNNDTNKKLVNMYANAISQLILLIYKVGYIHHDLHNANIIVSERTGKTMIIDFGRVSKLHTSDHEYLKEYDKTQLDLLEKKMNKYLKQGTLRYLNSLKFPSKYITESAKLGIKNEKISYVINNQKKSVFPMMNESCSPIKKMNVILTLLRLILWIDAATMALHYGKRKGEIKMGWIFYAEAMFGNIFKRAFDVLKDNIIDETTSKFGHNINYSKSYIPLYRSIKDSEKTRLFTKHSFRTSNSKQGPVNKTKKKTSHNTLRIKINSSSVMKPKNITRRNRSI